MAMCTMEMVTRASIPIVKAVPTFAPTRPGTTASFGCTLSAKCCICDKCDVTLVADQHLRWEYTETKQLRYCEADTSAERARSLTPGRGLGDVTGAQNRHVSVGQFSDASLLFEQKKKIFE